MREGPMDRMLVEEFQTRLLDWLGQGYQVLADDIDGELRVTAHFVSSEPDRGGEREQEFWPMAPEILGMLEDNGIKVSRSLAGPRPWPGPHPEGLV
jgi:hypothetical protein